MLGRNHISASSRASAETGRPLGGLVLLLSVIEVANLLVLTSDEVRAT
jgi:hypothetical protein